MTALSTDLSVEVRSANGSSTEFCQANEESVREILQWLAAPRLFAQPHLLLTSHQSANILPCRGIDLILVRTSARTPLKFPLNLPAGVFDIVEQSAVMLHDESAGGEDQTEHERELSRRRSAQVEIHTLGGWMVALKATAVIRGNVQDERHFFSHLPETPTIPFRLAEGGFGLINTGNIIRATTWPKPKALPGISLPLALRRWMPAIDRG